MKRILAFWQVSNPLNEDDCTKYGRHSFDYMSDEDTYNELMKLRDYYDEELDDDYVRTYNLDDKDDMAQFETDYNDEIFDGGWWTKILTLKD